MQQYVTITSQGQITIPAIFRRQFGLDKAQKAIIRADAGHVVIEPVPNIFSLRGIFASKKKYSRIEEHRAFEKALIEETV